MSTGGVVSVPGGSCAPGPSPSAKATRLDRLTLDDPQALPALMAAVGDGPFDVALPVDDPLVDVVRAHGFEEYARTVVMARRIDGFRKMPPPPGVEIVPYSNDWAEEFTAVEAQAMANFSFFQQVGSPTGFENAAGWGTFLAARRDGALVGFVQAEMPSGWINWIGVAPHERRTGIGSALVGEVAVAVRDAVGSHIVCEVDDSDEDMAMWKSLGFKDRTRTISLRHE